MVRRWERRGLFMVMLFVFLSNQLQRFCFLGNGWTPAYLQPNSLLCLYTQLCFIHLTVLAHDFSASALGIFSLIMLRVVSKWLGGCLAAVCSNPPSLSFDKVCFPHESSKATIFLPEMRELELHRVCKMQVHYGIGWWNILSLVVLSVHFLIISSILHSDSYW